MGGGGWSYNYSVSLSPNLCIMNFDLDLKVYGGLVVVVGGPMIFIILVYCKQIYKYGF